MLVKANYSNAQSGPYSPPPGNAGSNAIHKDSSIIVNWAKEAVVVRGYINIADPAATYNNSHYASFGTEQNAVNKAEGTSVSAVSLGDSGYATISFHYPIRNGEGYDFAVFENSFSDEYLELAFVEVSSDGVNFFRFPSVSLTQAVNQVGSFSFIDATYLYNLAGKYRQGFGTPFDLEELKDSEGLDVEAITHVRIVDVTGSIGEHASFDSQGNKVNDPFPTPFHSGGFDLDAVGVIHENTTTGIYSFREKIYQIYPNPSSGQVLFSGLEDDSSFLEIFDSSGNLIYSSEVKGTVEIIPKESDLKSGIYLIKLQIDDQLFFDRLMISK